MHRGLSFSEEMPTTTRCCVWHAQEKAGAKLSQKQAGLLGCLVPPLELVMAAGCYQPLCQSAPTAVHWWCLLLEPLGEPWWCFGGVTHLNPGCSLASPTHSTASRVLVTPGSDKCGQTRSVCLPPKPLQQLLRFFSKLAESVRFQKAAEFLKHRDITITCNAGWDPVLSISLMKLLLTWRRPWVSTLLQPRARLHFDVSCARSWKSEAGRRQIGNSRGFQFWKSL